MITETTQDRLAKILCVKEVADYVGLNERTIYRLANEGKMPAFKLGGKWLFDKEMIAHWLSAQMMNNYLVSPNYIKNMITPQPQMNSLSVGLQRRPD